MTSNPHVTDRRDQLRFPVRASAQVAYSTKEWDVEIHDMSMTGARLTLLSEHLLRAGDHIKLSISSKEVGLHLEGHEQLKLHGNIVYIRNNIAGIEYQPTSEMDKQYLVLLLAQVE